MKTTTLITAAIAALTLLGGTPSAEARSYHRHRSNSGPAYSERYLIGYDRYGYPIWGYRPAYRPVYRHCPPPPRYYPPPRYCAPPRPYVGIYYRSGR